MKKLLFLIFITVIISSCATNKITTKPSEFDNDLKASIIDGFYDNDTTKIPTNTYFLRDNNITK